MHNSSISYYRKMSNRYIDYFVFTSVIIIKNKENLGGSESEICNKQRKTH